MAEAYFKSRFHLSSQDSRIVKALEGIIEFLVICYSGHPKTPNRPPGSYAWRRGLILLFLCLPKERKSRGTGSTWTHHRAFPLGCLATFVGYKRKEDAQLSGFTYLFQVVLPPWGSVSKQDRGLLSADSHVLPLSSPEEIFPQTSSLSNILLLQTFGWLLASWSLSSESPLFLLCSGTSLPWDSELTAA